MLRRALLPLVGAALVVVVVVVAVVVVAVGWTRTSSVRSTAPIDEGIAAGERLRAVDAVMRLTSDFSRLETWDEIRGPDPYLIARMPGSSPPSGSATPTRFIGVLRGEDTVVLLDAAMNELSSARAPASPSALDVADDGSAWVAGEYDPRVTRFVRKGDELVSTGSWDLAPLRAIRGIATGPGGFLYVAEEHEGKIWAFEIGGDGRREPSASRGATALPGGEAGGRVVSRRELARCDGPSRLVRVKNWLIADCILDHRIAMFRIGEDGVPTAEPPLTIAHDGPIWSFDAVTHEGDLWLALGGVEDHPLDRTIGAFGYIDSFLFLYRVDHDHRIVRERAVNVSEFGVVTPKAIALRMKREMSVVVTGYGSGTMAEVTFSRGGEPVVRTNEFVPGTNSVAVLDDGRLVFADPLLDAWIVEGAASYPADDAADTSLGSGAAPSPRDATAETSFTIKQTTRHRAVHGPPTDPGSNSSSRERELDREGRCLDRRLGEALFFTTMMAPFNRSDGPLSRFTCETCHFEGYVDGRTHHTGRDDVHAVTKPLLGLFNNRPHFSRALDPDLTAVVFNEFRVAGAKSEHDPWFALPLREVPWVRWLGVCGGDVSEGGDEGERRGQAWFPPVLEPEPMRKALLTFLIAFRHRVNPAVLGRAQWSEEERRGATIFRDRCESCHEARLSTDLASSRVPFERWEALVMSREGAIVWASDTYVRSGILPYVHEKGARVPSLRRLYKKHPYFTNGSAKTLEDVLLSVRYSDSELRHDPGEESRDRDAGPFPGETLDETERRTLLAFLRLL